MARNKLIALVTVVFLLILSVVMYAAYLFAQSASQKSYTPPNQTSTYVQPTTQQVRKITLKNIATGETMELWADGTINYFDKNGNLKKTVRRGFAETISKFRDLEKLLNLNKKISGLDGYIITIETEQGTIIINPGDEGEGRVTIDDIHDYIDTTLHPTPRPSTALPTPRSTVRPSPSPGSSPQILPSPTPGAKEPFKCSDYYKSGKSIKISNIICGDQ